MKTKKQKIQEISDALDTFPEVITTIEENERYQLLIEQELELSKDILTEELTNAAKSNAEAGHAMKIAPEMFNLNIFKNRSQKVCLQFKDIAKITHTEANIDKKI